MPSRFSQFLTELRRRRVYHVAVAYVVVGWGVITGAQFLFQEVLGLPDVVWQTVAGLVVLGFPVAVVLAWAYEVRPETPLPGDSSREEIFSPPGDRPHLRGAEPEQDRSIVVLPFSNISSDPENDYFSDGLTEEIIADLSHVRALRVISRTSAMLLKGTSKDMRTMGRELGVRYVLEGSVRKVGDDLRVTAQLIDAGDDSHLWAEKYDGDLTEVFSIQERLSRAIVDALRVKLSPEESQVLESRPIPDLRAHECYLRALHEMWKFTPDAIGRALNHLQAALEVVGENPLVLGTLGQAHFLLPHLTGEGTEKSTLEMERFADRILDTSPKHAQGKFLKGLAACKRPGGVRDSIRYLTEARASDPVDPSILLFHSFYLGQAGHYSMAEASLHRLMEIEPIWNMGYLVSAYLRFLHGDFPGSLEHWDRCLVLDPLHSEAHALHAQTLANGGRVDEACRVADAALEMELDNWVRLAGLYGSALRSDTAAAEGFLTPELEATARWDETFSFALSQCLCLLGEEEQALAWLENAVQRGFVHHPFLSEREPFLGELKGVRRYRELMDLARKEWEAIGS